MLPWHKVLQQAKRGRWKSLGWNNLPWIIHPTFRTDSEKRWCKLRHVPSAPEWTSPWQPQQSKPLLKSCTLRSSPTTATVSFDRPSPSLPQNTRPSTSSSTWPGTWEELNGQRFESLLSLRVRRVRKISGLALLHHSWYHATHYTGTLHIPLEGEKKILHIFQLYLTTSSQKTEFMYVNVAGIHSKCRQLHFKQPETAQEKHILWSS